MQREQDLADLLVADRRRHADPGGRGGREIPADGFGLEPELGRAVHKRFTQTVALAHDEDDMAAVYMACTPGGGSGTHTG